VRRMANSYWMKAEVRVEGLGGKTRRLS
jgi:hypothetical protein